MRELRTCPVTGRVVLLHEGWVDRPADTAPPTGPCWYCAPHGPVIASSVAGVVVPHPTPALGVEGDIAVDRDSGAVRRDAVGAHELVSGVHAGPDAPLLDLVAARVRDLRGDARFRGFGAGRRHLPGRHVVWQVFALPIDVPTSALAPWRDRERATGARVVDDDGLATAILAWAPRAPFETWVSPSSGTARFGDESAMRVGAVLARALERIRRALRDPPIDLVLADGEPWRIELVPRLASPGLVEAATGVPIHGTFPEAAARWIREAG